MIIFLVVCFRLIAEESEVDDWPQGMWPFPVSNSDKAVPGIWLTPIGSGLFIFFYVVMVYSCSVGGE